MRKNKVPGGNIVATGSVAAVVPHESYPEYDGAKAAVCALLPFIVAVEAESDISQVVNFVRAVSRVLKIVSLERKFVKIN
jgi:short-subunit dehydrogenase